MTAIRILQIVSHLYDINNMNDWTITKLDNVLAKCALSVFSILLSEHPHLINGRH